MVPRILSGNGGTPRVLNGGILQSAKITIDMKAKYMAAPTVNAHCLNLISPSLSTWGFGLSRKSTLETPKLRNRINTA